MEQDIIEISASQIDALSTDIALKVFTEIVRRVPLTVPRHMEDSVDKEMKSRGIEVLLRAVAKFNRHCDI